MDDLHERMHHMFPEFSQDVDRRILHAETRIKSWVVGGILANVMALFMFCVPMVYYLGKMQAQFTTALAAVTDNSKALSNRREWIRDREMWEESVDRWGKSKGFNPPPRRNMRDLES